MSRTSRYDIRLYATVRLVGECTFLTNHALVLACIADEAGVRLRDIALRVAITERAVHRIVTELEADGYLTRHRVGTRNFYEIHPARPLCQPMKDAPSIGELLRLLQADSRGEAGARWRPTRTERGPRDAGQSRLPERGT